MQCSTVVEAVVKASSGDRSHVKEYMGIVCGEVELSGWHQDRSVAVNWLQQPPMQCLMTTMRLDGQ